MWYDTGNFFPVVVWRWDHDVLADHRQRVVSPRLLLRCVIAIGCSHPGDLGSGLAICWLTACHSDWLSASNHCYRGGRVLGFSWWMDERHDARVESGDRGRHRVAERRLKDVEIDKMEITQLREKILCTFINNLRHQPGKSKSKTRSEYVLCCPAQPLSAQ